MRDGYPSKGVEKHNTTVMTTFACGGGSSMGYKLAGYNVICANDIDPQMQKVYVKNHNPKQFILGPIKDLLNRNDLPKVDILDGSPPCSTFSTAGLREKAWGKEKHFREGQAKQVLDDLFFDFIKLADKIKPKIVISENVSGMLKGNAKGYVKMIVKEFDKIGFSTQIFLLNSATMGVPQKRERIFFISTKKDLQLPKIKLDFNEKPIKFIDIKQNKDNTCKKVSENERKIWEKRKHFDISLAETLKRLQYKGNRFTTRYIFDDCINYTITAGCNNILFNECRKQTKNEIVLTSSFPLDYDFMDIEPIYLMGMSVPPIMMAQVANQIYLQLLKKYD